MALDAAPPTTKPSTTEDVALKIEDVESSQGKGAIDEKPMVDSPEVVFIANTWPALFELKVALYPRQAPDSDSEEDMFNARVAGFHLASTSSSQSVALVQSWTRAGPR